MFLNLRTECPYGEVSTFIDLGHRHYWRFIVDGSGDDVGGVLIHPHPAGGWCGGAMMFRNFKFPQEGEMTWEVESLEPLTLSPSLRCEQPGCNDHGFIREGRWVPA